MCVAHGAINIVRCYMNTILDVYLSLTGARLNYIN